jgi:hypothetical protein
MYQYFEGTSCFWNVSIYLPYLMISAEGSNLHVCCQGNLKPAIHFGSMISTDDWHTCGFAIWRMCQLMLQFVSEYLIFSWHFISCWGMARGQIDLTKSGSKNLKFSTNDNKIQQCLDPKPFPAKSHHENFTLSSGYLQFFFVSFSISLIIWGPFQNFGDCRFIS